MFVFNAAFNSIIKSLLAEDLYLDTTTSCERAFRGKVNPT